VLTGILADPAVTKFVDPGLTGAAFGNFYQLEIQVFAAVITIVYCFVVTFVIFKVVGLITPLQETEHMLKLGDLGIHGEVAYPEDDEEVEPSMVAAEKK
jgi:Amt family ammonium transporter